MVAGLLVPTVAHADTGAVTVPPQIADEADVLLLGRSQGQYVVARNGGQVLSGPAGSVLADHGVRFDAVRYTGVQVQPYLSLLPHDLTGSTLRWGQAVPDVSASGGWRLHASDLRSGADEDYPATEEVLAWSPDGWIGYDRAAGVVTRHVYRGEDQVLLEDVNGFANQPQAAADEHGVVVQYLQGDADTGRRRLVLFTDDAAGTTVQDWVSPVIQYVSTTFAAPVLTPNSVVWESGSSPTWGGTGMRINRRARSGGPITTIAVPDGSPADTLAATDDRIVWTRSTQPDGDVRRSRMWSARSTDTTGDEIALPGARSGHEGVEWQDFGGLEASDDGDGFVFALGGDLATRAGVWAFDDGEPTRVATLAATADTVSDVALSGGRLTYVRRRAGAPAEQGSPIFQRDVDRAAGSLTLGAESPFKSIWEIVHPANGTAPALSRSGERSLIRSWSVLGQFAMFDGEETQTAVWPQSGQDSAARVSGPYGLADGLVYQAQKRGSGDRQLLDLPQISTDIGEKLVSADLFGSTVVWSTSKGAIRGRELAVENSRITTLVPSGAVGPVATWGTSLAWLGPQQMLTVRDLTDGSVRQTKVTGVVKDLRMGDGVLWWHDGADRIQLLDLHAARSYPVDSGLSGPGEVDDHLIAGLDASGRLTVQNLPFPVRAHRPRLIGSVAAASFDGSLGRWAPDFDLTKPVVGVKLKIQQGNTQIRTLTGTGAYGSVRDLSWDGLSKSGTPVPAGAYTWTLTATAADGEGGLTTATGKAKVTGTVEVSWS